MREFLANLGVGVAFFGSFVGVMSGLGWVLYVTQPYGPWALFGLLWLAFTYCVGYEIRRRRGKTDYWKVT